MSDATEVVHGTCVALGRRGALLRGPSGSGKSDLALRFLHLPRRGPAKTETPALVADDQVAVTRDGDRLLAAPAAGVRGRMEIRGIGIVDVEALPACELVLVVDLVGPEKVERLPETAWARVAGLQLPLLHLDPFEPSAPIKLAVAVAHAGRS